MGGSQWGCCPWGMPDFLQTRLPSGGLSSRHRWDPMGAAAFIVSLNSKWQSGREIKVRRKLIYTKPDGCQTTKQPSASVEKKQEKKNNNKLLGRKSN